MIDTKSLRKKILNLAVTGRLVKQDENDVPVSDDIKHYIPKMDIELPQIPRTWRYCKFDDVLINRDSERKPVSVSERKKLDKVYDYYGASGVIDKVDSYLFDETLLLIGEDGANLLSRSTPIAFLAKGKYWVNNHAHVLAATDYILIEFAEIVINSMSLRPFVTGAAQPKLSQNMMNKIAIPVPPLEEQQRIVDMVNCTFEILDNIDEIQSLYVSDREVLKNKLIDASIRGKLTIQFPEDRIAEKLFTDIQECKLKLIKEKKIKKEKALERISDEEIPFEIPVNWKWVRLGDICSKISSGNTPAGGSRGGAYVSEGYCFFREQNIYNDGIHSEGMVYITEELLDKRVNSTVLPKDILLNITGGSIGRCALVPDNFSKGSINQHILIIRVVDEKTRYYIHKCLCSPYYQKLIMGNVVGDKDGFSAGRCKNTLIPLPPLMEQQRIVDKIDELLSIIEC